MVRIWGNSDSKKKSKIMKIKFCIKKLKIVSLKDFRKEAYAQQKKFIKKKIVQF